MQILLGTQTYYKKKKKERKRFIMLAILIVIEFILLIVLPIAAITNHHQFFAPGSLMLLVIYIGKMYMNWFYKNHTEKQILKKRYNKESILLDLGFTVSDPIKGEKKNDNLGILITEEGYVKTFTPMWFTKIFNEKFKESKSMPETIEYMLDNIEDYPQLGDQHKFLKKYTTTVWFKI